MATAGCLMHAGVAAGFPLLEPSDVESSEARELAAPDAQDLRHQLQLASGVAPPPGGGWTIVPRITVQEMLNDNVFQVNSPRQADLVTYVSPGIAISGETSHLRLTVNYAPTIELYMQNGSQNALTQQLDAIGLLTVVPDRVFVDFRALAGVQATNGILGGISTLGPDNVATVPGGIGGGSGLGLAKNNRTQTMSVGVSPYVLGRLGQSGDYKIGASLDVSHMAAADGFAVLPFASGGGSSTNQTLVTTEEMARFTSGDYFARVQDQLDLHLLQSSGTYGQGDTFATQLSNTTTASTRETISNQVTWHYDQTVALFVSIGWENIRYSGQDGLSVNDATWSVGTTLTPNPDSFITISYGHLEGADSLTLDARYMLTTRTTVAAHYGSIVGTQLQNLQNQLDLAAVNGSGALVNGRTGGTLFNGSNLQPVQPGVYRFNTFTLNSTTNLDRDIISVGLGYNKQTGLGFGTFSGTSSETRYATAQWIHQLTPVMTLSGAMSYTQQDYLNGGGNAQSVAGAAVLQYSLSETLSTSLRYMFNNVTSPVAGQTMYQNLILVGVTKQF
jgi:hypothetical protein